LRHSLKKAAEEAASLTPEAVFAKMSPDEKHRLSKVRNIGIAVRIYPECHNVIDKQRILNARTGTH
jgi:hypothetical protein